MRDLGVELMAVQDAMLRGAGLDFSKPTLDGAIGFDREAHRRKMDREWAVEQIAGAAQVLCPNMDAEEAKRGAEKIVANMLSAGVPESQRPMGVKEAEGVS